MAGGRPGRVRQPERRLGQRPTGDDHATIKVELLYWRQTTFGARTEADHALVRYIDHPRRIQAALGGLSPNEYEDQYHRALRNPDR